MKLVITILVGLGVLAAALWILSTTTVSKNSPFVLIVFIVFMVPPLGAMWMIFMSIRNEHNPWPMIVLALVPFSFVWYYFERFRGSNQRRPTKS